LARLRVTAIGGDEQRGKELASILQRNRHSVLGPIDADDARLPQGPDVLACLCPRMERGAEVAVLVHETQGIAVLRIEVQSARLQSVGYRDSPDWAAGLGQMIGDSDRFEHPHR